MQMIAIGQNSYWSWAYSLSALIGKSISKQAIFYRMNTAWVLTVKQLVIELIGQQARKQTKPGLFSGFKNVWIHDSTCLQLPLALIKKFSGSVVNGTQNSVAKLNIIIHALTGFCPVMQWDSYTVTEQALSATILRVAVAGDLVIRDLGYFVLPVFTKMSQRGVFFLSRWKNRVQLFDIKTGEQINLLKLLKGKRFLDIEVLCGKEEQVKIRFVAIKLSADQTAERIRKAKQERDKRTNHDKQYYTLLGYLIFITNVSKQVWNHNQIAEAYRVRWNIEILFKSWKSGFCIERMIPQTQKHTERIESILYLLLLYIAWFQMLLYQPLKKCGNTQLSIIQVAKWALINTFYWINNELTAKMRKEILYYCRYDTRPQPNAIQHLEQFTIHIT